MATDRPSPQPQESAPTPSVGVPSKPLTTKPVKEEHRPSGAPSPPPAAFHTETVIGTGGPPEQKQ
jgi:hypothetical protein